MIFWLLEKNTIPTNNSRSKIWMVISFEKEVILSLSSGDTWFQVYYQHAEHDELEIILVISGENPFSRMFIFQIITVLKKNYKLTVIR